MHLNLLLHMPKDHMDIPRFQPSKIELANSLTHGIGILFGIVAIPIVVSLAARLQDLTGVVSTGIYGFSFLMVFVTSTLYHAFNEPMLKRFMKILDHIAIYFLIAGTFTPFVLLYLPPNEATWIMVALWGLTFVGTIFKAFFAGRFSLFSTITYLLMGWTAAYFGRGIFTLAGDDVVLFLWIGGGLYTIGAFFYAWKKYAVNHTIWHGFVLSASVCHYLALVFALQNISPIT